MTIAAPAPSAASITAALRVSIETAVPPAASRATAGRTRSISSPSQTGFAPGRVDSPPTSTIAAPASAMAKPAWTAASGSAKRPPSEKLSGVTLRIAATCGWSSRTTRSPRPSGARGEVRRLQVRSAPAPKAASAGSIRSTGTSSASTRPAAVHRDPLDRGEPEHSAGEAGDLAVVPERRVDEGGGPEIMAQGHGEAASA